MVRFVRHSIAAFVVVFLFMPCLNAAGQSASITKSPPLHLGATTLWEARRMIAVSATGMDYSYGADTIEFYAYRGNSNEKERFTIDLLTAPSATAKCKPDFCTFRDEAGKELPRRSAAGTLFAGCSDKCAARARSFADAFNALRAFAKDTNAPLRKFPQLAAAWRALAAKPPIPEEVRVQRLMAEEALKADKPADGLKYFETGIELYPTWPEGNFNAALIAGELGYYADAVEHMQACLELVPGAADAQAARDKILIWQTKAKEK